MYFRSVFLSMFFIGLCVFCYSKNDRFRDSLSREIVIAKTQGDKIKLMNVLSSYLNYEDNTEAEKLAFKALEMSKKTKNRIGEMQSLFTIANVYQFQGKLDKAVEYALSSLKIAEESDDALGTGNAHNALGLIFQSKGEYDKSLQHFLNAIDALKNTSNKGALARSMNNAGNSYMFNKDYENALKYMNEALTVRKKIGDQGAIADCYNDMGNVYYETGDREHALSNYLECHKIKESINDLEGISFSALNIAMVYKERNDKTEAKKYYEKSTSFARQINGVELLMYNYQGLADLYYDEGKYKPAYDYFKQYSALKDSMISIESSRSMAEMQVKYDTEKKEKAILQLEKKKAEAEKNQAIEEAKAEKEKMKRIEEEEKSKLFKVAIGGLVIIAGIIFVISIQRKKTNRLLSKQNHEIKEQKEIIEEKNRDILSSISYAQRIQEAILPPSKLVKEYMPDSFVLYKPKDIVSGDFYWMEAIGKTVLFAAVDCTGHGVPGAFVSIVGHNGLNRCVKEFGLSEPAKILDKLNVLVEETFEKSENEVKDGMDISLCSLDHSSDTLYWSGANNPLWIVRNLELKEIKPDKQPIGRYDNRKSFTNHKFNLQKKDSIYIFSDGFADQFGGKQGKKFKYSKMKELLLTIQHKEMEEQRTIINEKFDEWKGDLEQVDDVCIIGVHIT